MIRVATPAIVLRRQGLAEADRKVVLLTPSHGKVAATVKGVRWAKGKLVSLIEPFSELEAHLQIREEKGLATLIGGALRKTHPLLRGRLPAWAAACYLCELTDTLSPELVPHPAAFTLLSEALTALERPQDPATVRVGYTLQFLREIGYGLSEQLKAWNLSPEERRFCALMDRAPARRWAEFPAEQAVRAGRVEKFLRQFLEDYLPRPLLSAGFQETFAS